MERRIASPELSEDPGARALLTQLERVSGTLDLTDAVAYYDFPLFRDDNDSLLKSQTMFASRETGLVFFATTANVDQIPETDADLAQLFALAFGRLVKNQRLRKDRSSLVVGLDTCIYAPGVQQTGPVDSEIVVSDVELERFIRAKISSPLGDETWEELISTVEGSSALRREKEKHLANAPPGSKGAILSRIISRITSFDQDQRRAAITLVDGPQRIRGIAGSGKTVVLAMKAAHIHLVKPDANILITFWTKSLYDQFKYHVTRFYRQFSDRDPDWERIQIRHAWGGKTVGHGVYYDACLAAGVSPMTLSDLKRSSAKPSFSDYCEALVSTANVVPAYDYALIDEGQDLPSSFYKLCFALTRGGDIDRNIIWAYDELQTILDVSVQNVSDTFGVLPDGSPKIDLERAEEVLSKNLQPHDIVLKRSYRNSSEVIVTAHALGFGIYSGRIVQILENAKHWEDLGYEIVEGECVAGSPVRIRRPKEFSPINVSDYQGAGRVIEARAFADFASEISWVASEIQAFLADGLRPQDLLVVSLDDRNTKLYFGELSKAILGLDVAVNNLSLASFGTPNFFIDGSTTLSTVYKAKGNEAAVVFVVGVDAIRFDTDVVKARNKLFAALSRSRAWVRVSGVSPGADGYVREITEAVRNAPDLVFTYPDPAAVRTIQRDLAERSGKLIALQRAIQDLGLSNLSQEEISILLEGGGGAGAHRKRPSPPRRR